MKIEKYSQHITNLLPLGNLFRFTLDCIHGEWMCCHLMGETGTIYQKSLVSGFTGQWHHRTIDRLRSQKTWFKTQWRISTVAATLNSAQRQNPRRMKAHQVKNYYFPRTKRCSEKLFTPWQSSSVFTVLPHLTKHCRLSNKLRSDR